MGCFQLGTFQYSNTTGGKYSGPIAPPTGGAMELEYFECSIGIGSNPAPSLATNGGRATEPARLREKRRRGRRVQEGQKQKDAETMKEAYRLKTDHNKQRSKRRNRGKLRETIGERQRADNEKHKARHKKITEEAHGAKTEQPPSPNPQKRTFTEQQQRKHRPEDRPTDEHKETGT